MALNGVNKVFKILALILNVEDDEPGSTRLSCLVFSCCFTQILIISSGIVIVTDWLEVITLSQISTSRPFRLARMSNEFPCSAELNQDLVSQRALFLVTRSVCALCSYLKLLVCSICDHESTLGLRPIQSVLCALLLGLSPRPINDPRTDLDPSTQPSDRSLSTTRWPFISFLLRHDSQRCCLSSQPLDRSFSGGVLGTTIGIAIRCISRLFVLSDTILSMLFVFTGLRPEFVHCVQGLQVPLAILSALPSVFTALRLESVRCMLRYLLG